MKALLTVLSASGVLLAAALVSAPGSAQHETQKISDKCPAYVTAEATGPQALQYRWGVLVSSDDGPQRAYTWDELANFGKGGEAADRDAQAASKAAAIEAQTKGPQAVKYSWGVQIVTDDGPQVSYTWAMLEALRQPQSGSIGAPVPDYLFKPDNCD